MAGSAFGLVCGSGRFPILVAEGAKRAGHRVVAVGIRGLADPCLVERADEFYWTSVVRLGQWIRILKRHGCERAILAGSVKKADMYDKSGLRRILHYCPDWTTFRLWFFKLRDKRPDTVLTAIADEFASKGIVLEDCVKYTPESMATEGVLSSRGPSAGQTRDIEFGWRIAKELGRLDIGQSVAVKEQDIIAVEAIEGTDRMIERAGQLCKSGGWCHIKVSKPNQDMRFDVPTIGPDTIENLHRHGAAVLCVEAGKTFMVDPEDMFALAEKYNMIVVGRRGPDHNGDPRRL
jgi:hypothetical protein